VTSTANSHIVLRVLRSGNEARWVQAEREEILAFDTGGDAEITFVWFDAHDVAVATDETSPTRVTSFGSVKTNSICEPG